MKSPMSKSTESDSRPFSPADVLTLAPNVIQHQYAGGAKIRELRGLAGDSPLEPEEWVGSTTTLLHDSTRGIAAVEGGTDVRSLIAADPRGWLGEDEGFASGDSGVLLKLLDAGQRLPVHAHPDRDFAAAHLGSHYGKTEAWLILDAVPGAAVYVGWSSPVDPDELAERREAQDSLWMLEHMNRVEVDPGTSVVVPAGTMHAIDKGLFIAEIQEPSDFSIVVEWSATTLTRETSNLGLGWEIAEQAISCDELSGEALRSLIQENDLVEGDAGVHSLIAPIAAPFFRLEHVRSRNGEDAIVGAGFGVAIALDGSAELSNGPSSHTIAAGQTFLIPFAFGAWRLHGNASLIIARPARSDAN